MNVMRNNNDLDNSTLREILPIYLDDFIKDFTFQDISDYVNRDYPVFTDEECNRIKSLQDEKQQVILMFFILIENNKNIEKFLDVLKYDFKWLKNKISWENNEKETTQYLNIVHYLKSIFPKHSDFNVHRLKYYSLIREELKRLKPRHYLVIYGELGLGKKWLAIDACCDYGVVKAMNYNIFWLDVHNCDSQEMDVEKLQRLKILLGESNFQKKVGDYEGISNKILELQQDLRTILKQDKFKDCLLVLSNLQSAKTLETFNLHCKTLIVTRNKEITERLSSSLTTRIHISEGLTRQESIKLFEKVLNKKSTTFPENCNDLYDQSNGHPFLLNVIAQNLKDQPASEWNKWINNLENFQIASNKLQNVIELSLKVLRPNEFELYKTLSIFNHSVKIPVKVLASLWDKSEKETETVLKKFDKFSLINVDSKDGMKVYIIHFLYYSYLQNFVSVDKVSLNRKLIETFNIENSLNNRLEMELLDIPNHSYFYHYIGYHLRESHMTKIFPKLYLDFSFLGQKLRISGLSNTIGDLKYFRKDITGNDPYKEDLVDRLLEFLPNIEEMIYKSKDTCLLQYALMTGGILREEAQKQANNFSNKIWFFDNREHFRRRRQMIQLPEKPKIVKLIEPDTCLIALENHIMFMADLSLGYGIEPTKFVGHSAKVTSIEIFNKNYLISCDIKGEIRVWSIADERRRSVFRKQSIRRIVNHINYTSNPRMREKECLQVLTTSQNDPKWKIHNFYLEFLKDKSVFLYLISGNGNINIYKWDNEVGKFVLEKLPTLITEIPNIRNLLKLFDRYFLILNNCGSLKILKISDGSSACFSFQWPQNTDSPVNVHYFYCRPTFYVIFVFTQKILQLKLPEQNFEFIRGDLDILYEVHNRKSAITCSAIDEDNRFLIVGTKQGIMVFDVIDKSVLLRNSLSECIMCVDICSLDDDIYKYIVVSGAEGQKVLNIFGLKLNGNESISWANSIGTLSNEKHLSPHFEPNAWLLGGQLFDINFFDGSTLLVAVDSKNRIHQLINDEWTMTLPIELKSNVVAITAVGDEYFVGCENGDIYHSSEEKLSVSFTEPVKFLRSMGKDLLIAATAKSSIVSYRNKVYNFEIAAFDCFIFAEHYLILIEKKGTFCILDLFANCSIVKNYSDCRDILGSCDLKMNLFVIASNKGEFFVYKLLIDDELKVVKFHSHKREERDETCLMAVTKIVLSSDAGLCAVGFNNGCIEIYKVDKPWKLLQSLESHNSPIYDLKFSPWTELNMPIILVSCAEQLCFWNVTYILNNPLDDLHGYRRRSSRFNSKNKSDSLTNLSTVTSSTPTSPVWIENVWLNKKGPSDKPELNACIKFVGNKSEKFYTNEDFTVFITIDDEGEFYFLTVQDFCNPTPKTNGFNHNHHNNNDSAFGDGNDDEVII